MNIEEAKNLKKGQIIYEMLNNTIEQSNGFRKWRVISNPKFYKNEPDRICVLLKYNRYITLYLAEYNLSRFTTEEQRKLFELQQRGIQY